MRMVLGDEKMDNYKMYIETFNQEEDALIEEIEVYAKEHYVPIMARDGIETFIGLLALQKPRRILEIGSAIGYSAIRIARAFPNAMITTIERDVDRYEKAVAYIQRAQLTERIHIIEADALEFDCKTELVDTYDALFIDAAKGQYQRFFEKYVPYVESGGVIYCDNMFMDGLVLLEDENIPRRKRTMIRKLKQFTSWVMAHPDFDTYLLPIGDGLLIAIKKEA